MTRASAGERGFILVAVLWILAALATLASVYSLYTGALAGASHLSDDRLHANASLQAGIELAAYQLCVQPATARPTSGAFEFALGDDKLAVAFRSEGARIDLNAAPKPLLAGLFAGLGDGKEKSALYADRIIAWRKKGDVAGQNDEASAYKSAGYLYAPRQAPFPDVLELSLVRDLPADFVAQVSPFLTVFNGSAKIDPMTAPPEVLAALPGVTPAVLAALLEQRARDPKNGPALLGLLGGAQVNASLEPRNAIRLSIEAKLAKLRTIHADIVILITDGGDDPYRVLAWTDDFDAPI